ncbi:helix-hairpin-helix domain-containing protein [Persephonella sp.]|uniref:ComEA family DNA-binding protein n=1 Tax=Persephonella sp. TaxID=2060922 RepID=UPI0026361762|nr:helix-hairpin-helix domain-containing protein [Persephonella sp.]
MAERVLLRYQVLLVLLIVGLSLGINKIFLQKGKVFSPDRLKVNINAADINTLVKVPYIKEKTATKIIEIREKSDGFTDLNQLKNLRYYKKFKYFLKVE